MKNEQKHHITISLKAEYRAYYEAEAERLGVPMRTLIKSVLEEIAGGRAYKVAKRAIDEQARKARAATRTYTEAETGEEEAEAIAEAGKAIELIKAIKSEAEQTANAASYAQFLSEMRKGRQQSTKIKSPAKNSNKATKRAKGPRIEF